MVSSKKVKNFYQRWSYKSDSIERFEEFKRRVSNTISTVLSKRFASCEFHNNVLRIIGEKIIEKDSLSMQLSNLNYSFSETKYGKLILNEKDFVKLIFYIQSLFWVDDISEDKKVELVASIKRDIELSQLDIELKKVGKDYLFYPAGAKLLDKALVDDVLEWISGYNSVYKNYKSALDKYQRGIYDRNILDDLRLSLELLLKLILGNGKSLENQTTHLGKYLKDNNVSTEIRNMYTALLHYFCNYQNECVKHGDKVNKTEIEYTVYLTGTFMRFILTLRDKV